MKRLREWLAVITFFWLLGSVGACETGNITVQALIIRLAVTALVVGAVWLITAARKEKQK